MRVINFRIIIIIIIKTVIYTAEYSRICAEKGRKTPTNQPPGTLMRWYFRFGTASTRREPNMECMHVVQAESTSRREVSYA